MKTSIVLAVEDPLSEAVAVRLLALNGLKPANSLVLGGASKLQARAEEAASRSDSLARALGRTKEWAKSL